MLAVRVLRAVGQGWHPQASVHPADEKRTSMTSHGWSTSLRVGGMCTVTWDPLGEGVAARAMRDTRSAMLLADSWTPRYRLNRAVSTSMLRVLRSGVTAHLGPGHQ